MDRVAATAQDETTRLAQGEGRRHAPVFVPVAAALLVALTALAAIDHGRFLVWDGPITRAAVAHRTPALDHLALDVSRLGSWLVVFPVAAVLALAAATRSVRLAKLIVVVVAARPLVEWAYKEAIARPRPSGARLVAGTGFSFPSGHVLAAAATWAFLPAVVALFTRRRDVWRAAVVVAVALVVGVAWSRVWLGVHWTSDVVASLAIAVLVLSGVEVWLDRTLR
jgi:membrane-associated phospholipid phosphatase